MYKTDDGDIAENSSSDTPTTKDDVKAKNQTVSIASNVAELVPAQISAGISGFKPFTLPSALQSYAEMTKSPEAAVTLKILAIMAQEQSQLRAENTRLQVKAGRLEIERETNEKYKWLTRAAFSLSPVLIAIALHVIATHDMWGVGISLTIAALLLLVTSFARGGSE